MTKGKKERHRPYPAPSDAKAGGVQVVPVTQNHKVVTRAAKLAGRNETRQNHLKEIENELLEKSLETMKHVLDFASVPFEATEVPEDLIELYGQEKAESIFRTIKAGQMSAKDAPIGVLMAQKVASSIIKARAAEKGQTNPLNIAIQVIATAPQYEVMDLDD